MPCVDEKHRFQNDRLPGAPNSPHDRCKGYLTITNFFVALKLVLLVSARTTDVMTKTAMPLKPKTTLLLNQFTNTFING